MNAAPKDGEWWVVEQEESGARGVAKCFHYQPSGSPHWLLVGDDAPAPAGWYRPVRKVILGRAAPAKKAGANVGANLGASAQNGR